MNLWHHNTANEAPGDRLLDETLALFAKNGLSAHFDEGASRSPRTGSVAP